MAVIALIRCTNVPVSMLPPRTDCASTMAFASLPNVGRNRNARLITNAISCACMPNFAKGLSNASNASVMAVGVVVARNTAPTIMTTTNLQAYSMAIRTPSSVIGIGPMFVRTLPDRTENILSSPQNTNNARNT